MHRWYPQDRDEALDEVYDDLPPGDRGRWVAVNMVAGVDGGVTIDGVSQALGGEGDLAGFRALRAAVDVVLVGAGTARTEGYGPAKVRADARRARRDRGQAARPVVAVVTRSLDLRGADRLFEGDAGVIVVAPVDSDPDRRAALVARGATVVVAGVGDVDLEEALAQLAARGLERVLVEGGPTLNRDMLAAGLVDELFVTVAPVLVGAGEDGIVTASLDHPIALRLREGRVHDGELLLRYDVLGPRPA